jgi:alpha-2-macroglobulin family protein
MPRPRRRDASGAKLSVELLSSTAAPVNTDVNVPVVSTKISAVGGESNFDVQLISTTPLEKIERLPVSYILMTNGRIILTGEFFIEPTRECQSNTAHAICPEERKPPTCLLKGTLSIKITRAMVPYSTLLVYTFQPTFGFYVAKPYRFSVDGLFKSSLTLNATIVQVEPSETVIEHPRCNEELNIKPVLLSPNVQDRTRVKLTFTGTSGSIVGINVVEYDALLSGLSNNMTKERSLKHVTSYEHESFVTMPSVPRYDMPAPKAHPNKLTEERLKHRIPEMGHRPISKTDEEELIRREQQVFKK